MILSFRTDRPGQTVQTQIRLLRVYTVCHFVCIVWTHYSMVEPHSSNFRVITTNCLGVRIFREFTVLPILIDVLLSRIKSVFPHAKISPDLLLVQTWSLNPHLFRHTRTRTAPTRLIYRCSRDPLLRRSGTTF